MTHPKKRVNGYERKGTPSQHVRWRKEGRRGGYTEVSVEKNRVNNGWTVTVEDDSGPPNHAEVWFEVSSHRKKARAVEAAHRWMRTHDWAHDDPNYDAHR